VTLQERYRASERLVCRVVGQHRSTQRHGGKVVDIEEATLRHRLREIASEHIRWGRRMAYRLLRREGWLVNHKRVHRLWREESLQRPTQRTQKPARPSDGSVRRHQAEHLHQVWAMDFQFDANADGRRLKFLNVVDEHSRLCLAIRVGRRCKAKDVVALLQDLTSLYPAPAFIRSDNDRFRDEFLNSEPFSTPIEAQLLSDQWRREYNTLRPYSALQGRTPLEAAQQGAAA
jgi:putative transposase